MMNPTDDIAVKIHDLLATRPIDYIEVGRLLSAAKHKSNHGDWMPWLDKMEISQRNAQIYMQIFERFRNTEYAGMNLPMTLLRELVDFDDKEIEERKLYSYTVQNIKSFKQTGILPELHHEQPKVRNIQKRLISSVVAPKLKIVQSYEAPQPDSERPAESSDNQRIDELERRIEVLERLNEGMERNIDLIMQLIRK